MLAQKLEHVAEDKIVTPNAYVAVPAIQAISYSMDSEELRNLYANLLAKSMNIDTKDYVHPAYVNIISQMTPLDAKILQFIMDKPDKDFPIVQLIAANEISQIILQPNITPITFASIKAISISIENLSRNNLVYIINQLYAEETDGYNSIYNSDHYKNYIENQEKNMPSSYPFLKKEEKACILSAFGKSFCDICIS